MVSRHSKTVKKKETTNHFAPNTNMRGEEGGWEEGWEEGRGGGEG